MKEALGILGCGLRTVDLHLTPTSDIHTGSDIEYVAFIRACGQVCLTSLHNHEGQGRMKFGLGFRLTMRDQDIVR